MRIAGLRGSATATRLAGCAALRHLETHGLDLAGGRLVAATAVSADGRAIAGTGINPAGGREAWLAVLPAEPASASRR